MKIKFFISCVVFVFSAGLFADETENYLMLMSQRANVDVDGIVTDENGVVLNGVSISVTTKMFNPKTQSTYKKNYSEEVNGNFKYKFDNITTLVIKAEKEGYLPGEYRIDYKMIYEEKKNEVHRKVKDGEMKMPQSINERAEVYGRLKKKVSDIKIAMVQKSQNFTRLKSSNIKEAKKKSKMSELSVDKNKRECDAVIEVESLKCKVQLILEDGIFLKAPDCKIVIAQSDEGEFIPPKQGFVESINLLELKYDGKSSFWVKSDFDGTMIKMSIAMFYIGKDKQSSKIMLANPIIL